MRRLWMVVAGSASINTHLRNTMYNTKWVPCPPEYIQNQSRAPILSRAKRENTENRSTTSRYVNWREHDTHAYHIIVCSCRTSSFHIRSRFCARNSSVNRAHRSIFSGLTKSAATLMQSDRLHTYRRTSRGQQCVIRSRRKPE